MPHPIISVPKDPTNAACGQRNCHKQRCFKKQEIGRTRGQTQTNMGADANAHCPAFADKYRFQISESTSIWP